MGRGTAGAGEAGGGAGTGAIYPAGRGGPLFRSRVRLAAGGVWLEVAVAGAAVWAWTALAMARAMTKLLTSLMA